MSVIRPTLDLALAWPLLLERLRTADNEHGVRLWLGSSKVRPVDLSDEVLCIECPTVLFQQQIRDKYAAPLATVAAEVLGVPVREVRCRVSGRALGEHQTRLREHSPEPATDAIPRSTRTWGHGFKMLEQFVVGSCNRLAYDAVSRILDDPRSPPNPLFIHGASGLGKTHLEQGLAVAFRERHPKSKVQYIRCEQFTNDYITACEGGPAAIQAFRVRMRHPDLLLIDDIHFLSQGTKVRTKEELFATFNELSEQGKRVVITSDASPRDIQYLEDRFIQRFSGGLVVHLTRPDPAVRREVIRAKARAREVVVPDEVVDFVADHITDNIRELEGAVHKLEAFARSFGRRIDLSAARQALADTITRSSAESLTDMILREVASHYALTPQELTGRNRSGMRATARHVAMYVLKLIGSDTYAGVAHAFGVKSHSSVAYACEQVAKHRTHDAGLDGFISDLMLRAKRS